MFLINHQGIAMTAQKISLSLLTASLLGLSSLAMAQ
jgi:hypothetical protein